MYNKIDLFRERDPKGFDLGANYSEGVDLSYYWTWSKNVENFPPHVLAAILGSALKPDIDRLGLTIEV